MRGWKKRETKTRTTREGQRSIERSGQCRGRVREAEEMKGCLLICSLTGELKLISETSVCLCVCRWLSCQEMCRGAWLCLSAGTLCVCVHVRVGEAGYQADSLNS